MAPRGFSKFRAEHPDVWGFIKDIAFALALLFIIIVPLYLYAGMWPPMVSVYSDSMTPHMYKGDLIIIQALDRGDVKTQEAAGSAEYEMFGETGDVIVYHPLGNTSVTPIIHRAIRWVNENESMWPGGPLAPYAGYITLGDNNSGIYDQMWLTPGEPVKPEWIVGMARIRIPYLGYLRMLLPY